MADKGEECEGARGGRDAAVWELCVPRVLHPVKVAVIETHLYIRRPMSPRDLEKLFDDREGYYLSMVAYHCNKLVEIGVLELWKKRPVRGVVENLFVLSMHSD